MRFRATAAKAETDRTWESAIANPSHAVSHDCTHEDSRRRLPLAVVVFTVALFVCLFLCSCGSGSSDGASGSSGANDEGDTSGPTFNLPSTILASSYNADGAISGNDASIDVSSLADGYVAASATNSSRLKFQVSKGEMSYNYDLPSDGTPIVAPLNMGSGPYTFRVMQNTSGDNYVEILSVVENVQLSDEFQPFLRPNVFVNYNEGSAVVSKARELAASAENEGDVMRSVYYWVVDNISYDHDKATQLASATGYVPNPDETLSSGKGICFDYASLCAAMLRSLGIPCKVMTGYVAPEDVYHAWNMVYINGEWVSAEISVHANDWTRVDLTFAASGAGDTVGDGSAYTERYTY